MVGYFKQGGFFPELQGMALFRLPLFRQQSQHQPELSPTASSSATTPRRSTARSAASLSTCFWRCAFASALISLSGTLLLLTQAVSSGTLDLSSSHLLRLIGVPPPLLLPHPLKRTLAQTLVLYELYYSKEGWGHLHNEAPYKPVCVYPGAVRRHTGDVDAPRLLKVIRDTVYQKLICEYGAIFAVSLNLPELQKGISWVAFQSWRAADKGWALSEAGLDSMGRSMRELEAAGKTDVFYFWADFFVPGRSMYDMCDE